MDEVIDEINWIGPKPIFYGLIRSRGSEMECNPIEDAT